MLPGRPKAAQRLLSSRDLRVPGSEACALYRERPREEALGLLQLPEDDQSLAEIALRPREVRVPVGLLADSNCSRFA